jgi:hypothetical protein
MYSGKIAVPPGGGGIVLVEELTVRVMQTAKNIRENAEMLMRTQASYSEGHMPA